MERQIPVIGIIGMGLIGGSLGLALRASGGWRIAAYDPSREARTSATALGACDEFAGSVEDLSVRSDIVVVATPSSLIPEVSLLAARHMRRGGILTDTGSVKSPLQKRIMSGLPAWVRYVGGHPMAGSDKSGLVAASPDLFRGHVWALTACDGHPEAVEMVKAVVRAAGATPLMVDARDHDLAVAYSSHLPYLLAVALALSVEEKGRELALVDQLQAGGFRDATRLARSDPSVAMDYCYVNRTALLGAVTAFERRLRSIKTALRQGDLPPLMSIAAQAREYLQGVSTEGRVRNGDRTS